MIVLLWLIGYFVLGFVIIGFLAGRYGGDHVSLGDYVVGSVIWPIALLILAVDSVDARRNISPFLRKVFGKRAVK